MHLHCSKRVAFPSNPACLFLLWMGLELLQSEGAPVTLPPHRPPLEELREHKRPTLSLLQAFCTNRASHIEGRVPRFSQEACRGCSLTWFSTISPTRSHNSLAVAWHPSAYRAATASRTAAAAGARLQYLIPDAITRRIFEDCLLSGHVRYRSMNAKIWKGESIGEVRWPDAVDPEKLLCPIQCNLQRWRPGPN